MSWLPWPSWARVMSRGLGVRAWSARWARAAGGVPGAWAGWTAWAAWIGAGWNYESGMVAGAIPDYASALALGGSNLALKADEQAAMGLFCGNTFATLNSPILSCAAGVPQGATRIRIPPPGTENDDKNPPRIAPRNVFDLGIGDDNLFQSDKRKVSVRFAVSNLTNKVALYNFLSTFSGTHFLAPRTFSGEIGYSF